MSTAHIIAQLCMLATLILMITGKTPIYMTAIVGAAISALIAGFPMAGGTGMTVTKMIVSGLNPVIADMTGILLFIGIMQATGFLDVIPENRGIYTQSDSSKKSSRNIWSLAVVSVDQRY